MLERDRDILHTNIVNLQATVVQIQEKLDRTFSQTIATTGIRGDHSELTAITKFRWDLHQLVEGIRHVLEGP
jgi:hypothetical protein